MYCNIAFHFLLFFSIPFHSILFFSIQFHSILFYAILFYSILFYSSLFYAIPFYSIRFDSTLFYSIPFFCVVCLHFRTVSIFYCHYGLLSRSFFFSEILAQLYLEFGTPCFWHVEPDLEFDNCPYACTHTCEPANVQYVHKRTCGGCPGFWTGLCLNTYRVVLLLYRFGPSMLSCPCLMIVARKCWARACPS